MGLDESMGDIGSKRSVRDSNPQTNNGLRFSRPVPRPAGHAPYALIKPPVRFNIT